MTEPNSSTEIWKDIPGWENLYQASSLGRIRSVPRKSLRRHSHSKAEVFYEMTYGGRVLATKAKTGKYGYLSVHLSNGEYKPHVSVASLVLLAFTGPRPDGYQIHHIDNDCQNNNTLNLMYIDAKEHQKTIVRPAGERNGLAKLKDTQITDMRLDYMSGLGCFRLGQKYGVSKTTALNILRGRTWKHIPFPAGFEYPMNSEDYIPWR